MSRRNKSILRTFYLSFIAITILIVLAGATTSIFIGKRINDHLVTDYSRQQSDIAKQTAATLQSEVANVRDKLLYVAQIEAVQSLDPATCNAKIDEILKTFGLSLGNLGRINPNGIFYCSGNKKLLGVTGSTLGSYVNDIFTDPAHKPVMSRMIYPAGATSYVMAIHVPVFNKQGKFAGSLGGAISVSDLAANYLNNIRIGKTGYVSVVDDNGDIIFGQNKQNIGKNRYSEEIQKASGHNPELNAAFENAKNGKSGQVAFTSSGIRRIAVLTSAEVLPGRRWVVYGVIPQTEIARSAQELGLSTPYFALLLGYGVILFAAGLVLIIFMRRRVFGPLKLLGAAANDVQEGNITKRVDFSRADELGNLAGSFNAMLDRIKNYNKDLEEEVKLKTKQLSDTLSESEQKNKSLEDTKKAVVNILEDLGDEKDKLTTETVRAEAMFSSLGDGLIVIDEYGAITRINPVAEELLNLKQADAIGKWYIDLVELRDAKGKKIPTEKRPIMQAIDTGKTSFSRDYYMQSRKSEKFPVALTVSPFLVDGRPVGVVEIFRDITKERQLDQAKDEFVSLVSHQLRTPATAVKQFLGMIREGYVGKVTKEQAETVENAYASNERQIAVIDDLLNVSRLDLGKLTLNVEQTDLSAMLESIKTSLYPRIAERQQTVIYQIKPGVTLAAADQHLLYMSIENIIENASKYTPDKGKVQVSLTTTDHLAIVQVSDSGVGIAHEDLKSLFAKFKRFDNELSVKRGGSGLGLYLAKQIIDLHHGKINVESRVGKGTTFTIELKLKG